MLLFNQPIDKFTVKFFSTKIGYHYKIYSGKQVVAQSYVYFHNQDECVRRMWDDIEILKAFDDKLLNKLERSENA